MSSVSSDTMAAEVEGGSGSAPSVGRHSDLRKTLKRFVRSPAGVAGAITLIILAAIAIGGSAITPYDPLAQDASPLLGPSGSHWFGTDQLGRDILSRVMAGTASALQISLAASALACVIGVPIGIIAGYRGRWADALSMRFVDVILAMPTIVIALVIVAVVGASALNIIAAIAFSNWPIFARLARAGTLTVRTKEYVLAARAMGAGSIAIMWRAVLPNILPPILVQFVITASLSVVTAAALSFLGLGLPPPTPSWGSMLHDARTYLGLAPWFGVLPGLALTITIASFDGIGRGLRSALGDSSVAQAA